MQIDSENKKLLTLNGLGFLAVLEDGTLPLDVEETTTAVLVEQGYQANRHSQKLHATYTLELPIAVVAEKKRGLLKVLEEETSCGRVKGLGAAEQKARRGSRRGWKRADLILAVLEGSNS